ncbi:hypothetical protein ACFO4E_00535 [Nocardiopsis mangrovi]|uniref:BrnT family toxin n=1 Tax=Nocardiopsis mangrovi TaxID=1179818 RepID=A0ABV9DPM5_9ACTN
MFGEIMWTEQAEAHIARHCVTPDEVETVLGDRKNRRRPGRGVSYVFGRTDAGRCIMVVAAESMDGRTYIATARDMSAAELRWFRKVEGN